MPRPDSVTGLALRLLRLRGVTPVRVALGAALAAGLALAVSARVPSPAAAPDVPDAQRIAFDTRPFDENAPVAYEPVLVATSTGWLAAWTLWGRGLPAAVELAALTPDGALAAPPRTLSSREAFSRSPGLACGGDRCAVAWSSRTEHEQGVRPYVEFVDAAGRAVVDAALLSEATPVYDVAVAHGGGVFAFAWQLPGASRTIHFARRDGEGHRVGEDRALPDASSSCAFDTALAAAPQGWLVVHDRCDFNRDRGAVVARWLAPDGAPAGELTVARFAGATHHVRLAASGASHLLTWGEDGPLHSARHDPRFARLDGRAFGVEPAPLAPRRSASPTAAACNATGCSFAWVEAAPGAETPELFVERRGHDGLRVGNPLRVPARGGASLWLAPALATAADGATQLLLLPLARGGGLFAQRLDAEGRLLGVGHVIPLR
ncbi:MAG: hypothetical protein U0324_41765 [Polyangiales bacterium]